VCVEKKCNPAQYSSTWGPRNSSVPRNMKWSYMSFKVSVRVLRFLGERFLASGQGRIQRGN